MPRVELKEQPSYEFCHALTVRFTDINQGGHLATQALVGLLQEARAQVLRQLGFSSLDLGVPNVGLVVADLAISFRQEGSAFDLLEIDSHVGDIGRRSFRIFNRVNRDGELLALAETGLVCFDFTTRQSVPIPKSFIQALKEQR